MNDKTLLVIVRPDTMTSNPNKEILQIRTWLWVYMKKPFIQQNNTTLKHKHVQNDINLTDIQIL